MTLLLASALKSCVVLAAALACGRVLRFAALRHVVLAAAIGASAAIPVLSLLLPHWSAGALLGRDAAIVSPAWIDDSRGWLFALWTAGAVINIAAVGVRLARLAWLRSRCDLLRDSPLTDLAIDIGAEYRLSRPVTMLQSENASLLGTWGIDPKVVVPAHAQSWDAARAEVVLRHELAHVRRHDWLLQTGAELVRAVYWFNPLLWIACRRLRDESEYACDDEVMRAGVEGAEYATLLVELARTLRPRAAWWPAAAMARPSTLERRVRSILSHRTVPARRSRAAHGAAAAAMFVLALPIAAIGRPSVRHELHVPQPPARTLTLMLDGRIVDLSQGWPPTPDPNAGLVPGRGLALAVRTNR